MKKIRNSATWTTMSSMSILLADDRLNLLSADTDARLFVLACFGVIVAVFCQGWILVGWVVGIFSKVRTIDRLTIGGTPAHPWWAKGV